MGGVVNDEYTVGSMSGGWIGLMPFRLARWWPLAIRAYFHAHVACVSGISLVTHRVDALAATALVTAAAPSIELIFGHGLAVASTLR